LGQFDALALRPAKQVVVWLTETRIVACQLWVTSRHHTAARQRLLNPPKRSFGVLRRLPDLVRHRRRI